MTKALNKFFASKKVALATVLAGIAMAVLSQLPFLSFRKDLQAIALGLMLGSNAFSRLFTNDWKKYGPFGGDFLSKAFFLALATLVSLFVFIVINEAFLKLW